MSANPPKGNQADLNGFGSGYYPFFGTNDQPNKPAYTPVKVVLPAGPYGALVEIDMVVVRPK